MNKLTKPFNNKIGFVEVKTLNPQENIDNSHQPIENKSLPILAGLKNFHLFR